MKAVMRRILLLASSLKKSIEPCYFLQLGLIEGLSATRTTRMRACCAPGTAKSLSLMMKKNEP